jgi:hypothetical protein
LSNSDAAQVEHDLDVGIIARGSTKNKGVSSVVPVSPPTSDEGVALQGVEIWVVFLKSEQK